MKFGVGLRSANADHRVSWTVSASRCFHLYSGQHFISYGFPTVRFFAIPFCANLHNAVSELLRNSGRNYIAATNQNIHGKIIKLDPLSIRASCYGCACSKCHNFIVELLVPRFAGTTQTHMLTRHSCEGRRFISSYFKCPLTGRPSEKKNNKCIHSAYFQFYGNGRRAKR